ncbi:hypothetical protein CC85DRAFT_11516 [Cutaneotrichosporon oleaginosum]|uniref:Uncharacterized protein n=1 Tax=Cutaneotrichosporon oleaginosum TaxID=879819 RepID=A0A0J0XCZ6_9TREE|nr:uncharacterized protein CC85DRAFT_11516 [Cutaneotrichosporon oleaginosum]KLT38927.1 hypothetical protein CC85DRAFT_11516 [Cutaneotrichosporon oleaginosum]TXT14709.1 hypothetical protein COLE_00902 [Cutaneotrichosporon oleaginosum]
MYHHKMHAGHVSMRSSQLQLASDSIAFGPFARYDHTKQSLRLLNLAAKKVAEFEFSPTYSVRFGSCDMLGTMSSATCYAKPQSIGPQPAATTGISASGTGLLCQSPRRTVGHHPQWARCHRPPRPPAHQLPFGNPQMIRECRSAIGSEGMLMDDAGLDLAPQSQVG